MDHRIHQGKCEILCENLEMLRSRLKSLSGHLRMWPIFQVRGISTAQVATALRPFYLAVHPDLFGKYPAARDKNDDSLKLLKNHLDKLHNQQKVQPMSLLFYLRRSGMGQEKEKNNNVQSDFLHTVRIPLQHDSVKSTVSSILQSCDLPLDYINSISQEKSKRQDSDVKIQWHHTYYSHYGIPNPDYSGEKEKKMPDTLSSWLSRNLSKAQIRQAAQQGIRVETERLKQLLRHESGLSDIQWACDWGLTQYRASLRGFLRVYRENRHHLNLKDQTLIFGHANGVCLNGNVIVKDDDLADSWLPFLKSIPQHMAVLDKLAGNEAILSHLLAHVNIVRRESRPVILADQYLAQLKRLSASLEAYYLESETHTITADLRQVDLAVDCARGPLHITPAGQVLIPFSCPAFLIVDYLNDNAYTARLMKHNFQRKDQVILKLTKTCETELDLGSLTSDTNITYDQMEACCKKLLLDPRNIGHSLEGCHVKVAQFYSVMSNGEISIPWNWIGSYDDD